MLLTGLPCNGRGPCALLVLITLSACGTWARPFNATGIYATRISTEQVEVAPSVKVPVIVTFPSSAPGPFPLIVMFNGFECQAPWYSDTMDHVASWGYVTLQYTVGLVEGVTLTEPVEVTYLDPLLAWLTHQTKADSGSPLEGRVDMALMAVMGHSHGGKLASLHYSARSDVQTMVLLDPVDCGIPRFVEWFLGDRPSAVAALEGLQMNCSRSMPELSGLGQRNKSAAVVGAGVTGGCNPAWTNYVNFSSALLPNPNSWQLVVNKAGHMQFARAGFFSGWPALNTMCQHGNVDAEVVIGVGKTIAVAWFDSVFRPVKYKEHQASFAAWLEGQMAAGVITVNGTIVAAGDAKSCPLRSGGGDAGSAATTQ